MNRREYKLMQIIQKVEAFRDLEVGEFQRLLGICRPSNFDIDDQVYTSGQQSEDMLIILTGKLKVLSSAGEELGIVNAGASMGEMGMFTGEPRSATVVAVEKTGAMVIQKDSLMGLMKQDAQVKGKILQNMVDILSERVIDANKKMMEQSRRIHQLETQLGVGEAEPDIDLEAAQEVLEEAEDHTDPDAGLEENVPEDAEEDDMPDLEVEEAGEEDDA